MHPWTEMRVHGLTVPITWKISNWKLTPAKCSSYSSVCCTNVAGPCFKTQYLPSHTTFSNVMTFPLKPSRGRDSKKLSGLKHPMPQPQLWLLLTQGYMRSLAMISPWWDHMQFVQRIPTIKTFATQLYLSLGMLPRPISLRGVYLLL